VPERRTRELPAVLNRAQNSRCIVITDLNTSKRSTQKAFFCCDAILETSPCGPAVSMRIEQLVAQGHFTRVRREIDFLLTFETSPCFCVYSVCTLENQTCKKKVRRTLFGYSFRKRKLSLSMCLYEFMFQASEIY
jgi:hypothetical protein